MDDQIKKFIDILTDNKMVIKQYTPEWLSPEDPRFDNFKFNEELLLSEIELEGDELLLWIEQELPFLTTSRSFKLNGCSQPWELEEFLESESEKFGKAIIDIYNAIDKKEIKEIVNKIKYSRSELEWIIGANSKNQAPIIDKLISVKIDFCAETIRFINFQLSVLSLQKGVETKPKVPERSKKPLENLTSLNQNEVSILAYYLKEQGYIGKEMTKIDYAKHFSELTGFAAEKIRQDLSHLSNRSSSVESVEFQEREYKRVKRALDQVIAAIKKDTDEKYSSPL